MVCADYLPPFDQWLTQLKYGQQLAHAATLAAWLAHSVNAQAAKRPDVLVPVPCTAHKLRQRGYNQAALIADHLGRLWGLPVEHGCLRKIRDAAPQADLSREERQNNLNGVFVCTRPLRADLRIGLVDDVITTGATLEQCTRALRKAGARHIDWFAICRTPE
ncbi:MAG TPA: ComF family protein [Limnobacter sp.]|nr:ComF family protein [Limnobacter sp.]